MNGKKLSGPSLQDSPLAHISVTNTTGGMRGTGTYLLNCLRNRFVKITEEIVKYTRRLQGR